MSGGKKLMNLEVTVRDGKRYIRCAKCVGSGTILVPFEVGGGGMATMKKQPCPECNGSGEVEVP